MCGVGVLFSAVRCVVRFAEIGPFVRQIKWKLTWNCQAHPMKVWRSEVANIYRF